MAWEAPSPKGWSDDSLTWLNPDAMRVRLDIAQFSSWWYKPDYQQNVVALAKSLFDSALSGETRTRLQSAGSPNDALTLLFASPEFQRR
jgi:uncharacterized protein (DUF1800 family)